MRLHWNVLAAFVTMAFVASGSQAGIVVDQGISGGFMAAQASFSRTNPPGFQYVADDFTLALPTRVTRLSWVGLGSTSLNAQGDDPQNYTVQFYRDDTGTGPSGSPVASFSGSEITVVQEPSGWGVLHRCSLVPTSLVLDAGKYDLCLWNDVGDSVECPAWYWISALRMDMLTHQVVTPGNGQFFRSQSPGVWEVIRFDDMNFMLQGDPAVVPEPAITMLFGMAVAGGLIQLRRRRRG